MKPKLKTDTYDDYLSFALSIQGQKDYHVGIFYLGEKTLSVKIGRPLYNYKSYGDCFCVQQQVLDVLSHCNRIVAIWDKNKYIIDYKEFIANSYGYWHIKRGDQKAVPIRLFKIMKFE